LFDEVKLIKYFNLQTNYKNFNKILTFILATYKLRLI
jgi:hypothetical protein